MKKVILIKEGEYSVGEVRVYGGLSDKEALKEAEYWFIRRIEKEGWRADEGYIVEENDVLPLDDWEDKENKRIFRAEEETKKEYEKSEYQRLKEKFEPTPKRKVKGKR
ncbi:MAG: hypothetical protein A2163_07765 [Actinobacteria bacterium RBG_13_35_12]|nr:MAG: hypothetical protein A2163_07765 [Actinobacteria bacterium RBG_13_35_12]